MEKKSLAKISEVKRVNNKILLISSKNRGKIPYFLGTFQKKISSTLPLTPTPPLSRFNDVLLPTMALMAEWESNRGRHDKVKRNFVYHPYRFSFLSRLKNDLSFIVFVMIKSNKNDKMGLKTYRPTLKTHLISLVIVKGKGKKSVSY